MCSYVAPASYECTFIAYRLDIGHHHSPTKMLRAIAQACAQGLSPTSSPLAESQEKPGRLRPIMAIETRRNECTFLGSGCHIRTHLLSGYERRLDYQSILSRSGREAANDEEAAGLSNAERLGEKKFHFSCARTGSFLGGQSTTMQKRFGLNN